jgi:integrase
MAKKRSNNEGSIYRRKNGTWRAMVSIAGKRVSFSAKTKAECQKWIRKMLNQVDQGWNFEGSQITLTEYLFHWLDTHKVSLRDHTVHRYRQLINNHIVPNVGSVRLNELVLARIESFYASLISAGVGIRTIREIHAVLHKSLKKAVRYGYIQVNPAHGAALPRYKHAEMQILDESQVSQFLIAAHNSKHMALFHIAVVSGARQGELFGLKWSDLLWNSGILYIKRQVQQVPGQRWKFTEPKTKSGRRTIKLRESTLRILRDHYEQQQIQKVKVGKRWQENELIFPSTVGTPLNPSNLRLDFIRTLELGGLPRIRFHDLRHTAASLMLNHGIPVIVVSKILGHAKPSTTMDIYGHLIHDMQDEAARVMESLVTPIRVDITESVEEAL